ncbi:packaged DNA stabilization gp4 family protein, partial [Salmonella enterica]|uniref:packaged DNA stabilization gp4 family protein n=1 Tax=Salmonella enterica TaxID=28901 RepID=UPI00398C7ED4
MVRAALRKLGVESDATLTDVVPQSMPDAVDDLEAIMAEWYQDGKCIVTGSVFPFDDNPPSEGDDLVPTSSTLIAAFPNRAYTIATADSLESPDNTHTN